MMEVFHPQQRAMHDQKDSLKLGMVNVSRVSTQMDILQLPQVLSIQFDKHVSCSDCLDRVSLSCRMYGELIAR